MPRNTDNTKTIEKRRKKVQQIKQQTNKAKLLNMKKFHNKMGVSSTAVKELKNPETIYILGGEPTYTHAHSRTWQTGLHTSYISMQKMLKSLVAEQRDLIKERIEQINNIWNKIYKEINLHEQKMGSGITINNWDDFVQYYNSLQNTNDSSLALPDILQYKMTQSTLSSLNKWRNETQEEYIDRLWRMGAISAEQAKNIKSGTITVNSAIKPIRTKLEGVFQKSLKSFFSDKATKDWISSLGEDTKTRQKYEKTIAENVVFEIDPKQLGLITERALSTQNLTPALVAQGADILTKYVNNELETISKHKYGKAKKASLTTFHTPGTGRKDVGGLSDKIHKGDITRVIDLGDVTIQIPSSVKLSMRINKMRAAEGAVVIEAEDLLTAGAQVSNLNFDTINEDINSSAYRADREKIHRLTNYVYRNLSVLPTSGRDITLFNNAVIYYLAWLKLVIEIVGNPKVNSQLAIAIESINSIHNAADILQRLLELKTPAAIKNIIYIDINPLNEVSYSPASYYAIMRSDIDREIATIWDNFLHHDGEKPSYQFIYTEVMNILSNYSVVTKRKLPSVALIYRIKLKNTRVLTI